MGDLVVIGVHHHQRVDVVAFALGLGTDLLGFRDSGKAGREVRPRDGVVRVVHESERDAPVRHGAGRVGLDGVLKDLFGIHIPIGVLIAHPAIEAALCHLVARGLEVNITKLLIDIALRDQRLRG